MAQIIGSSDPIVTDEMTPFDVTLAVADTAEDLVAAPGGKTGRELTLHNAGPGDAYIAFDAPATTSDLLIPARHSWATTIPTSIGTKVSFIGAAGKTPRVFGALFSG